MFENFIFYHTLSTRLYRSILFASLVENFVIPTKRVGQKCIYFFLKKKKREDELEMIFGAYGRYHAT